MTVTRNDNVFDLARTKPDEYHFGYGAVSYDPAGYPKGYLPGGLKTLMPRYTPTIFSYGTPIAWRDGDVWIKPDVRYSNSTGRHQSSVGGMDVVIIPADCDENLYRRIVAGKTRYVRDGKSGYTVPGPNFDND